MSSVSAPIPPKHTRRQLQEDRRAVSRPTIPCDPRLQPLKLVYTSLTRVPSLEVRPSTEKQFGRSSAHFSSASPTVPRWPDHPQRFGRWRPHRVTDDALNFLLLLGSISFIVMAALAAHLDRKQAATPDELDSIAWARNLVWFTTTLGVTIYPILFATAMGRALKNIALWAAERGEKLGRLEQMIGSNTLFGTLATQISLRGYNALGIALVIFWSLSPLGGQASLRLIEITGQLYHMQDRIQYTNTEQPSLMSGNASIADLDTVDKLYLASYVNPQKDTLMYDLWKNVRIPVLEALNSSTADSDGWVPVPSSQSPILVGNEALVPLPQQFGEVSFEVQYSSLLGIPTTSSDGGAPVNGSFTMSSSYYLLDCPRMYNTSSSVTRADGNFSAAGWQRFTASQGDAVVSLVMNGSLSASQANRSDLSPRRILFESRATAGDNYSVADCTVFSSYVESMVACKQTTDQLESSQMETCGVTKMRRARHKPVSALTPLSDYKTCANFLDRFCSASVSAGSVPLFNTGFVTIDSTPSYSDQYYWTTEAAGPLHSLFNTYWLATVGLAQLNQKMVIADIKTALPQRPTFGMLDSVTTIDSQLWIPTAFVCHKVWLVILVVSAAILFIVGMIGMMVRYRTLAPDILGTLSSLTRDNPHVPLPQGGTTLNGIERSRMLFDLRVRIQDVKPHEQAGHIALASYEKDYPRASNLDKRRFYL